jgi:hypothetical protein
MPRPEDMWDLGPTQINDLHTLDDVDTSADSHHHTLGRQPYQAAPGNHNHGTLPVAWYRGSIAQTIPASTWTRLELATKVHLNSEYFTFNDAADQIEVKKAGLYLCMGRVAVEAGAGGQRYFRFRLSGISWLGRVNDSWATDANELSDTIYIDLQPGQYIGLDVYSTGATTTRASATADEYMFTQLQVIRLSEWVTPI